MVQSPKIETILAKFGNFDITDSVRILMLINREKIRYLRKINLMPIIMMPRVEVCFI